MITLSKIGITNVALERRTAETSSQSKTGSISFEHVLSILVNNSYIWNLKLEHCWFLEHWKRQKSLTNIWQRFSCLLDEWNEKKKKNHDGFLRFAIHSLSRHEKHCQMLQTLFWLSQCSRNSRWNVCAKNRNTSYNLERQFVTGQARQACWCF